MAKLSGMKVGGEATVSTPEQLNTLEVKRVTKIEFRKYEAQIRGLSRNALNTREGTGLTEREKDVTDLYDTYLEDGELYVGIKNNVVVTFVALKKTSEGSTKKAVIEQVRFAAGLWKPEEIVRSILKSVKKSLEKESVHHVSIKSDGEQHSLSVIKETSWYQKSVGADDSTEIPKDSFETHQ